MSTDIYGYSVWHDLERTPKVKEVHITARELQALYDRIEKLEESLKYVEDMLNEEIRRKDSRSN